MTSYACPMSEMVIDSIEEAVNKALSAGMELDLHLVWEPAWDPSMMYEEAKQRLGWE
jgi:metal-sulfur cluster biosynthetic enzyme